jgi:hypothetical protein
MKAGSHDQEKRRRGREASPEVVDHLPACLGGDARSGLLPAGAARPTQDPGEKLPVASHPPMLATSGNLIVGRELLEERHVRE